MLNNVNIQGLQQRIGRNLKISKNNLSKRAFIAMLIATMGATSLTGCSDYKTPNVIVNETVETKEPVSESVQTDASNNDVSSNETTEEKVDVNKEVEIEVNVAPQITELTIEEFDKFVDEVEKANKEAGLNLRRENLELAIYINNIDLATPELIEKIESAYNYNEEDMINVYLKTITSYNNDKLEYYNGEDTKAADESLMFIDQIDRQTIQYIDFLFEELYVNSSDASKIELTLPKFNKMVDGIIAKNEKLGIEIDREAIEISVYQRNSKYATDEVKEYINTIKLAEGQTLENVDFAVLNVYKNHNMNSQDTFELSNLEYESSYVGAVVEELEGYTRENNEILGYTKDQLTVGGLFTAKLKIDDAFAYFATTGYANEYEPEITGIAEANLDAVVARTYAVLGSKASLVDCEDKSLNK